MITKSCFILAGVGFLLLSGCAQGDASSQPSTASTSVQKEEATVIKGAKTAAHFVVGKVVGTPAKVAMAAGSVVQKIAKNEDAGGDPASNP